MPDERRGRPPHRSASNQPYRSKADQSQPGDEQVGGWPRSQLIAMDSDFCERMQRAIERGQEHPRIEEP